MERELITEQIFMSMQAIITRDDGLGELESGYARGVIWMCLKAGFISEIEHTSMENLIEALEAIPLIHILKK